MSASSPSSGSPADAELDALRERFGASAAWTTRRDGPDFILEKSAGLSSAAAGPRWPAAKTYDRLVLERRDLVFVANAAKSSDWRELYFFSDLGYQSFAGIPRGHGVDGVVAIAAERPLALSENELAVFRLRAGLLGDGSLDKAGVILNEPFARLIDAEIACGKPLGIIAIRCPALKSLSRDKGAAIAERLLAQVAEELRISVRRRAPIGRLDSVSLGVLLTGVEMPVAQRACERIAQTLRQRLRWATSSGLGFCEKISGGAQALQTLALQAADRTQLEAAASPITLAPSGPVPAPIDIGEPAPDGQSSLGQRFQRLALLNRMSSELFSEKPYVEAIVEAAHIALALTQAKAAAFFFSDASSNDTPVYRSGEPSFTDAEALREESAARELAGTEKRLVSLPGKGRHWIAAPLLRLTRDGAVVVGSIVFGHYEAPPPTADSDLVVVEIARILRNARLIQQTLQQQRLFADTVAQSSDAIIVTDAGARVLTWNRSASALFQYSAAETIGRDGRRLAHALGFADWMDLSRRLAADGQIAPREQVCRRRDGTALTVEMTGTILRDENRKPFGAVFTFRDVTERRATEILREELVSLVSHELRTPLTAIQGFAELLEEDYDKMTDANRRRALSVILLESRRLARLASDYLDLSRLESGKIPLSIVPVDVLDLFSRVRTLFAEHPSHPQFKLKIEHGAESLRADAEQVYRLLVNLSANAVKYTPPGGQVTLSASPQHDAVVLSVADEGPGISDEDRRQLFHKFFRANDDIARASQGTGLGLAICKGIVEAHGGEIWVESSPGSGARFCARIPFSRK